ncbi:hypothetical protein HanXRQr2_Chr02g0060431 [Helianthus annuus]|uniref:Uncharacterized protein n=1 Tax=Helianthus annuus TaxID=4232 RepID=A0A9K3P0P6_HELAN|nr:hypothetical protein HanXRQr2_Chr02g0060431 [Helianthus annuus]KAJ0604426.1 hypothetical protein HanHA300_Chr02g0049701 [Helianthus annuus]
MKMMTVVWIFLVKRQKRRRGLLKIMQLQRRHLERRKNVKHWWNGGILSRWRMELPQHHPPTRTLMTKEV